MATPVTVQITVDATGAVAGSQQAQQAITTAVNNIGGATQKMGAQTATASRFLERFGDAPKRGISALDALNATILQSTGGFQALGPASAAASTGLRAALFAMGNLLPTTATIAIALTGLATVFALTGNAAEKTAKQVEASGEAIRKLAEESGIVGASAQKVLAKSIVETEAAMGQLRLQMQALSPATARVAESFGLGKVKADALKVAVSGIADPKSKQSLTELVNQYAILAQRLDGLTGKTEKQKQAEEALKKTQEIRFQLLTQGIAAVQAQATTIEEHNNQILKNIQLQIQQQQLTVQAATTHAQVNAALSATIALLEKEYQQRLLNTLTTTEEANLRLELQNKIIQAEQAAANQRGQIDQTAKRNATQLQQRYNQLADTISSAFTTVNFNIAESFKNLLNQMLNDLLRSGLKQAILSIVTGNPFSFAGFLGGLLGFGGSGGIPGSDTGQPTYRPSAVPALSMPSTGGGVNINIQVNSLDAKTTAQAIDETVIPAIKKAVLNRRVTF